jgi:hypothetical protein
MAEIPWWHGIYADHLYETCPARTRTLPDELRGEVGGGQGRGGIDPLGTDVCGWCRRVWIARNLGGA